MATMALDNFENVEKNAFRNDALDRKSLMTKLNSSFKKAFAPETEAFSVKEVVDDNGLKKVFTKSAEGTSEIKYYQDDKLYLTREKLGDNYRKTYYDDNENSYITEVRNNKGVEVQLKPGNVIRKGNFEAKIDNMGRPVENKITDLQIREGSRSSLSDKLHDKYYREIDDRGHLIADDFGGINTKENIVPQTQNVNRSKFATMENKIRELKAEGHKVDYEVKSNYTGTSKRPTSFEFSIKCDGKEIDIEKELGKEYTKIYNNDGISTLEKKVTDVGEKVTSSLDEAKPINDIGIKGGVEAAAITGTISTVDNVTSFVKGDITAEDAVSNIVKDTGTAGALGYGTTIATSAIAKGMSASSHELINTIGHSSAPAAVVSFAVSSYDDTTDFMTGKIDAKEYAYNLGENAAGVAGGIAASAAAGAIVGSVVPGAGTAVGAAVGVVSGVVGTAAASVAYKSAVSVGSKAVTVIGNKVTEMAKNTVEAAKTEIPEKVDDVKNALNKFATDNNLPFKV